MVNSYPDIAVRPGFTLHNQGVSKAMAEEARDAAAFQRILDGTANTATTQKAPVKHAPVTFMGALKGLIDIINPLQHIPVVSAIYRHVTGDEISPSARFIGDALYGGPVGGAIAAADIVYQKITGKDAEETVIAALTGPKDSSTTQVAQNMPRDKIIWSDTVEVASAGDSKIVWASPAPLFPSSLPTGTNGEGSAHPSTTAPPVPQPKSAASTTALQAQEAPAEASRTAATPELIATKMMEGLQKYAAMKPTLAPQISANY